MRIKQIDRPKVEPFSIQEAEALILGQHVEWGEAIGNFKDKLWCSKSFGHGVEVMLKMYAAWIEGTTEADIELTRRAMAAAATGTRVEAILGPQSAPGSPKFCTNSAPEEGWGRLSWRKRKHFNSLTGGADGTFQSPASY
jgi:hypothetical protein